MTTISGFFCNKSVLHLKAPKSDPVPPIAALTVKNVSAGNILFSQVDTNPLYEEPSTVAPNPSVIEPPKNATVNRLS